MSVENGNPEGAANWVAPERRKRNDDIKNIFAVHEGTANELIEEGDNISADEKSEIFESLKPMKTFEEYVQTQRQGDEQGLRDSEVEQAAEVDAIVAEFNADLPRIKAEQDANAILAYCQRLGEVSKGE